MKICYGTGATVVVTSMRGGEKVVVYKATEVDRGRLPAGFPTLRTNINITRG